MSLWNHLPIELHGALWEGRPWEYSYSWWSWKRPDGYERREVCSSTDWQWRNTAGAMAQEMRDYWQWWILTDRDEALRAGRQVDPWKHDETWFRVGPDLSPDVPWKVRE